MGSAQLSAGGQFQLFDETQLRRHLEGRQRGAAGGQDFVLEGLVVVHRFAGHDVGVRMSRVSGRKSPITGSIVIADVVPAGAVNDNKTFKDDILAACRAALPAFKVPAQLRFVDHLELTAGGKLSRHA